MLLVSRKRDMIGHHRDGKEPIGEESSFDWEEEVDTAEEKGSLILVGKLWATRSINVKAAIETMTNLWNPSKPILGNVVDAKEKTFIFRFEAVRDKDRVLEGQPWHFDKFLWCFAEPNRNGKLTDVSLFHFPIWTRIYDLPIAGRTCPANARRLGDLLGSFINVEYGPNVELDRAIRIRVLYDIRKPLKATIPIRMRGGKTVSFDVKYERLPTYCYGCGLIGHGEKDCEDGPYEDDDLKFGEWLRASPWKVVKTIKEGPGKAAKNLRSSFDAVKKQEDEDIISNMIDKLKAIAIDFRTKKKSLIEEAAGHGERVEGLMGEEGGGGWSKSLEVVREQATLLDMEEGQVTGGSHVESRLETLEGEVIRGETVFASTHGVGEDVCEGGVLEKEGGGVEMVGQHGTSAGMRSASWTRLVRQQGTPNAPRTLTESNSMVKESGKRMRDESSDMGIQKKLKCVLDGGVLIPEAEVDVRWEGRDWRLTGFYGWPAVADRHLSWELMRLLSGQSSLPWVCVGDFNEILFSTEMKGGCRPQREMDNFRAAVDDCQMRDVPWEGYAFSFDNGQAGDANRQSRLDRALCTAPWLDLFPFARLIYLDREWSDHAPIKLVLNMKEMGTRATRPFRFEQIWVGEEGCGDAVERGVMRGRGDLVTMLDECARELRGWQKLNINKIGKDLERKRKQLANLNEGERSESRVHQRRVLVAKIATLQKQEEQYWRQRSRALWLKDGDRNTKFFHTRAGERKRKNFIAKLIDDNGVERIGDDAVSSVANEYFHQLFTTSNPSDFEGVLQGIGGRVSTQMNVVLRADYNEAEVIDALNQMHPLKAPGPDGMNGLFYQTYWSLVGPEVVGAVLAILRGERSPRDINKTNIVLIPKKKAPDKIRDFRPISLCNVVYKLVSKVLANRLKPFLGDIVSENQGAFTPGRAISDNVLIAFEAFHFMRNSRQSEGHMAIKLDMAKAYDRVEWRFLERVLLTMGFDERWTDRVMECVSTVSFAVLINGKPSRTFRPTRGLRQGDPLSPYLFILCAEVLSDLMRRAIENNAIHGVRIAAGAPVISHLLFADDSIFFIKATEEEADVVSGILRQYESASGQLVNLDKTTVSFSKGVPRTKRSNLANRLGIVEVEEQERYLGLPTVVGRSKKVLTNILRDKLSKRLEGWRGKILSRAGKEVLLKAVANSLPTYVMSIFKIPVNFCEELRSMMSRFWWGHEEGKRGISWVAWKKLCQPKGMGGMGFRDFKLFNLALLSKQAWRLTTETDSLWARVMKARYYPNAEFLSASLGHHPSYTWRGIHEARATLLLGLRRRVGNGLETRVWGDAWVLGNQTGRVISPCAAGNESLMVSALMGDVPGTWNGALIDSMFLPFEGERIKNIRLSENMGHDMWFWSAEKDGILTVRSAYRLLAGGTEFLEVGGASNWEREKWLWSRLWKIPVWPRVKLFFWQLCSEALATRANIATRVRGESSFCSLCNSSIESSIHLFRDCVVAQRVWEGIDLLSGEEACEGSTRDWVEERWRDFGARECGWFMVGCWALWEHRNNVVFNGKEVDPFGVVKRIRDVMDEIEGGGFVRSRQRGDGMVEGTVGKQMGWSVPKDGFVKINTDAGVREGEGVSLGVVCRDGGGKVLWGLSIVKEQAWEVHVAEAVAVLEAVREAGRRGHAKIIVESDCIQVVNALRKPAAGRSIFSLVLDDIIALCNSFTSVVWSYIRRSCNGVAHALAHPFPRVVGRVVWSEALPLVANELAFADLSLMQ
ncbi:uncharacterized protein LOC141654850 [Silene latifolia]|uniref:uncharacterized protein LOC141654850 n=1 Tax=Silene latifolia TaxID=37657 RepID=UPI003D771BCC